MYLIRQMCFPCYFSHIQNEFNINSFESDKVHAELLMYIFLFPKCLMTFQINLKYGMDKDNLSQRSKDTCTACAGTMILEFAALSRLTGEHVFEVGVSEILLSSGPA